MEDMDISAGGSASKAGRVRLTFDLSPSEALDLGKIAAARGCSVTQALGRAIETSSFLTQRSQEGARIVLRAPGGELSELILPGCR